MDVVHASGQRGEQADTERPERNPSHGGQLLGDVGERERQAHESEGGQRRVVDGYRDVQQVGPDGRAVAARDAKPLPARLLDFGPLEVVLDARERRAVELGIAETTPSEATRVTRAPTSPPSASASPSSSAPLAA